MSSKIYQFSDFFSRIEILREHLGITASAFAEKTGVSQSFYSELKAGRSGPSFKMLVGIFQNISNLNIYWLLFGEGEMFFPENSRIKEPNAEYGWPNEVINTLAKLTHERRNAIISLIKNMIELTENK